MTLTEAGQRYFEATARLLSELDVASDAARATGTELTGRLRITAGVDTATGLVGDSVAAFSLAHPSLELDFILRADQVDLVAEEIDVAIRIGKLNDSTLKAKILTTSFHQLFASPAYVKKHGLPREPSDLTEHRILCFTPRMDRDIELDLRDGTKRTRVLVRPRSCSNQIAAVRHQATAGCGIAYLPAAGCIDELDSGRLVPVLGRWRSSGTPVHVVYPQQRFVPRKVRAFVDFIVQQFAQSDVFSRANALAR